MKAERLQMDMKMTMQISMGAKASPKVVLPTMRMVMKITPTKVDADGTLSAHSDLTSIEVLTDSEIPKEMRAKLKKELEGLVGMKSTLVITSRGVVKDATVEVPANASPTAIETIESMKDSLRNVTQPFPEEAVGKGAKWDVSTVMAMKFTFKQTTHFTLTKISAKDADLTTTLTQEAPPQVMAKPASLPANATVHLDQYSGAAEGLTKVTLNRISPTGSATVKSQVTATIAVGSDTIVTDTKLELITALKPL
jgi:hypothetical protein